MGVCVTFAVGMPGRNLLTTQVFSSTSYHDPKSIYPAAKAAFMSQWPEMREDHRRVFQLFFARPRSVVLVLFPNGGSTGYVIRKKGDGSLVETPEAEVPRYLNTVKSVVQTVMSADVCLHSLLDEEDAVMSEALKDIGPAILGRSDPNCSCHPIKVRGFNIKQAGTSINVGEWVERVKSWVSEDCFNREG